ncbi:GNAT family N-acetyltransferase [Draconibacterium orientale]|uniref:GNAT family N-acetyltransferase n=1 Tax=Draconibacterium orientale TaxID=1168034 RepID=UPI0029BFCE70|nr:GNAT family N-acetyltransferase [Draconibacterium orientale]
MKQDLKINSNPTKSDFLELENWLIDEYNKFDEGFYCNWNIIKDSYKDNEVITLSLNDKIIGFVAWSQDQKVIHINIMEIHPDYRSKGFGERFFEKLELTFKERGYIAFELFCDPRESEHFWRKIGFIKFPDGAWKDSDLTFYKPLIKILTPSETSEKKHKIELWNVPQHESRQHPPKWIWAADDEVLKKPILQPCNAEWLVRWSINGKEIKSRRVKRFSNDIPIQNGSFMFIERLKF